LPLVPKNSSQLGYGERKLPDSLRPRSVGIVNRILLAGRRCIEDGDGAQYGNWVLSMVGLLVVMGFKAMAVVPAMELVI